MRFFNILRLVSKSEWLKVNMSMLKNKDIDSSTISYRLSCNQMVFNAMILCGLGDGKILLFQREYKISIILNFFEEKYQ